MLAPMPEPMPAPIPGTGPRTSTGPPPRASDTSRAARDARGLARGIARAPYPADLPSPGSALGCLYLALSPVSGSRPRCVHRPGTLLSTGLRSLEESRSTGYRSSLAARTASPCGVVVRSLVSSAATLVFRNVLLLAPDASGAAKVLLLFQFPGPSVLGSPSLRGSVLGFLRFGPYPSR